VNEPTRISFSRGAWAGLAAFALLLLATLGTQLALLEDQRSTTDRQLAATARQADVAVPLLRKTEPLVDQTLRDLPQTRQMTRQAITLTRDATPLVRELNNARAPEQLQAAGALARTLLQADAGAAMHAIRRADLPRLAATLTRLADELQHRDRLRRLLVRTNGVLGEVRSRHLIAKSSTAAERVPEIERVLRESLAVQRETLELTRQLTEIGRQTRDTALETRDHAREAARAAESLDRKTGPSLAAPSGG
jgi:hypothetical protein